MFKALKTGNRSAQVTIAAYLRPSIPSVANESAELRTNCNVRLGRLSIIGSVQSASSSIGRPNFWQVVLETKALTVSWRTDVPMSAQFA